MAKFTTSVTVNMTLTAKNAEDAQGFAEDILNELIYQSKSNGAKKVTAEVGDINQVVKQ